VGSSVDIAFRLFLGHDTYVEEPDLGRLPTEAIAGLSILKGQVAIAAPGVPVVHPEDELVPLILRLCFAAPTELTVRDHAVVPYANDYGYLRLDREGPVVRISGDGVPVARFPDAALLEALVDCGARFRAWSERTMIPGEDQATLAHELAASEADARRAIASSSR
jgi:hypothetical protein